MNEFQKTMQQHGRKMIKKENLLFDYCCKITPIGFLCVFWVSFSDRVLKLSFLVVGCFKGSILALQLATPYIP